MNEGVWKVEGEVEGYPDAVVYRLDSRAPDEYKSLWAINDDLLLMLDEEGKPRVGNAGFGYILNRTR